MRHPKEEREIAVDEYTRIRYEEPADAVVRILLDRPERRNAQDTRMLVELDDAFHRADRDESVDCIILGGVGPDFSAGHELRDPDDALYQAYREVADGTVEGQMRMEREFFYDFAMGIRDVRTPTVASVQGNCILAAIFLANVCDLIVASDDARFINRSLRHCGTSAEVLFLPYYIGVRKTKELIWTGDPLHASDAKEVGLVNRVVPRDDLEEETLYLARRIALNGSEALKITKESLNYFQDQMGARDANIHHFALHQVSHHFKEWQDWNAEAAKRQEEGGFGAWIEFQDGPFRDLAEEYGKEDPRVT